MSQVHRAFSQWIRRLVDLALVLVLITVFCLGFYWSLECFFERYPQLYRHPARWSNHANSLWIARELKERTKPAILFAGSSTTRTAFDERIIEELTNGRYYVENLSNSTTDPCGIYAYLLYLEKHCPEALPDILIQGIEELELQGKRSYHAFHSHLTHFFADYGLFISNPIFAGEMKKKWRRKQVLIESTFPLYARRALFRGLVTGSVIWPLYEAKVQKRRVLGRDWLSRFHLRPYTWNYFRFGPKSTPERRMQGLNKLKQADYFNPENYPYPNAQTDALTAISSFCRRNGILHFAVMMPGVPEKFKLMIPPNVMKMMVRAVRQAYEGLPTTVLWCRHFLNGTDFFDSLHINQFGRGPFTRFVAQGVIKRIDEQGLPQPYRRRADTDLLEQPQRQHIKLSGQERSEYAVPGDERRRR